MRGIPEERDENISEVVIDKLANFLGEQVDNISYNFEAIYRVNSNYASQKKLPRDVVVQMISRKIKEDIITKSFRETLEIYGKPVKILKELPRKVIRARRNYRQLTEKLKEFKIRFRWENPEGLSFLLKGKRGTVANLEMMHTTLGELEQDMDNDVRREEEREESELCLAKS